VKLRYWFILFLSTGLITTACKTSRQANNKNHKNLKDSTNTNTQITKDSTDTLVRDSIILNDTTSFKLDGDSNKVAKKSPLDKKVDYNAQDSIVFDASGKTLFLYDTAQINYGDIELKANYIEINMDKKELWGKGTPDSLGRLQGKPHFKQGEQSFDAKEIGYNFDTKKGLIKEAFTSQGEIYLHAEVAKKDSNEMIYVKNAKFTTCTDPDHPHFYIQTTRGKVVKDKVVVTGPAIFKIADIPTPIVVPFGYFPNDNGRTSGLILPQYGDINPYGFFLKGLGYYFAINNKMDLTIAGDIYTSLSFGVRAGFRYNKRYKYSGEITAGFSQFQYGDPQIGKEFNPRRDVSFTWKHNHDPKANPTITFQAEVRVASGGYQQLNSSNVSGIVQNQFASNISFSKSFRGTPITLTIAARHSQNTAAKTITVTLPDIVLNVMRFNPFKRKKQVGQLRWYENIGLTYSMNISNNINTIDTLLVKDPLRELSRMNSGVKQTISVNTNLKLFKFFTLTPSVNYTEKWHFSNLTKFYNPTTMSIDQDTVHGFFSTREMNANATLTTIIYGMYTFKKGNLKAIRHVMTPTITANFRPDLGDQISGYFGPGGTFTTYSPNQIGIFGQSPSGMSGTVGFNINNNIEMKVVDKKDTITGTRKIPILEVLNIAMQYDFARDSLNLSNLAVSGRTTLFNLLGINFAFAFDPYAYRYYPDGIARKVNTLSWMEGQGGMRLTNASLNLTFNLKGQSRRSSTVTNGMSQEEKMVANNPASYDYVDFNVPYTFAIGYNISYSKPLDKEIITHAINLSGDFNITGKWKIGFTLNYDIQNNQIATSQVSLYRDLHCWDMSFQIIPFGIRQSYMFTIKVKSALLQMLKLQRQSGNSGIF
jgi:lipopolysaccharide assembly outer membrane protein LptD (OstA)